MAVVTKREIIDSIKFWEHRKQTEVDRLARHKEHLSYSVATVDIEEEIKYCDSFIDPLREELSQLEAEPIHRWLS